MATNRQRVRIDHACPRRRRRGRWLVLAVVIFGLSLIDPAAALAAPETTITAQPSPGANDGYAQFIFVADVSQGTTFECQLDSGAYGACTSPKTYTGISDDTTQPEPEAHHVLASHAELVPIVLGT